MTRYIVTAAPPNPNGDLHLGHLAGPFLGADVQARYLRGAGHQVAHVSYIDEHSCYVPRRARELSAGAYETAHLLGTRIEQTLAMGHMAPDLVARPHRDAEHDAVILENFGRLWQAGALYCAPDEVYWCATCSVYLYEAEIRGACHYCGAASDGFYCEECGRPQTSARLADPKCTGCGGRPEVGRHQRIFFPLEDYRDRLRAYFADRPTRPRLRAYLDMMFAEPLPATPVSRAGSYGVAVPDPAWQGHYLDTWFCGLFGYLAATRLAAQVAQLPAAAGGWQGEDVEVLEFLGFDCSFSHAVLWVAMAMALGDLALPAKINTNEFYRLEGGKFSTSRGHAIWGGQFLASVPADSLRFHLCLTGPETEQTNFSMAEFATTVRTVLVDGLERLLDRFDDSRPSTRAANSDLAHLLDSVRKETAASLEPAWFSPAQAAQAVCAALADPALAALVEEATPAGRRAGLVRLAWLLEPFLPGWSSDILRALDDSFPAVRAVATAAGQRQRRLTVAGVAFEVRSLALDG